MLKPEVRRELAQTLASIIGSALRQTFEKKDGRWWLFTNGVAARELRDDEIEWHTARRHKPFVSDGIDTSHPDWWKDPT